MKPNQPNRKLFIIAINMTFALVLSSPTTKMIENVTPNSTLAGLEEGKVEVSEELWIEDIPSSVQVPKCHLVNDGTAIELFAMAIMMLMGLIMVLWIVRTRRKFLLALGPPPPVVNVWKVPKVKMEKNGENGEKVLNPSGRVSDSTWLSSCADVTIGQQETVNSEFGSD